jgi:enoyl-CoA hydratase
MSGDEVVLQLEENGSIAVVILNRPEVLNAFNTAMATRLGEVLDELSASREVRVLVLAGAGERAFCTGGDLKERRGMTPDQWTLQHRLFESTHWKLRNLRKPVFAAVNGYAVGGGAEMAMSTDFIICSESARFGLPEVTRGIQPGAGGTQLLPRMAFRGLALQMLMTGETIDAEEAFRIGLVNKIVPNAELMTAALQLASRIARNSPSAVQQAKHAAVMGAGQPLEHGIEIEIECYQRMVGHPDRHEGVNAFNEKRPPAFSDAL